MNTRRNKPVELSNPISLHVMKTRKAISKLVQCLVHLVVEARAQMALGNSHYVQALFRKRNKGRRTTS